MPADSILQHAVPVAHASDVAVARRAGRNLAIQLGFGETLAARVELLITEVSTNILKHAGEGEVLLMPVITGDTPGIEILALDRGPGIVDIMESLRDGVSSADSPGCGLGALQRLSDELDVYSMPGLGSAIYLCLWATTHQTAKSFFQHGAVCLPHPGEELPGDAWSIQRDRTEAFLLLSDGLGHGPDAALASRAAVETFEQASYTSPQEYIHLAHQALASTRGAAIGIAKLHVATDEVVFAGVGNISACVLDGNTRKTLLSHSGIVGQNLRKVQEFTTPLPPMALCILHSDGLDTQWDLNAYPGLMARHPTLIAGILYRDFSLKRDDVSVLVVRILGGK